MSRASVRVRPADLADVPAVVRLAGSFDLSSGTFSGRPLADPSEEHLTQRIDEIVREGSRILLLAVDDGDAVVGLLVARHDEIGAIDLTPVLHITHLMVAADFRRRGVGRQLLTAAVHVAEDRGIDHLVATATTGSREGNRYLARLGFAPLVVHRIASTGALRRRLGLADAPERMAVLRRARLVRGSRSSRGLVAARARTVRGG